MDALNKLNIKERSSARAVRAKEEVKLMSVENVKDMEL